jgi:hypothetical protein
MLGSKPVRNRANHFMVGARFAHRLDRLARDLQESVAAGDVEVVML